MYYNTFPVLCIYWSRSQLKAHFIQTQNFFLHTPFLSSAVHQCSQPQQSFTNKRCQKKRRRCMDFFHISAFLDICFGAWLFRSLYGCLYMLFLEEKDLAQPKWIQMWKNMPSWFGLNWAEIKVVTFEMDDSFRYTTFKDNFIWGIRFKKCQL